MPSGAKDMFNVRDEAFEDISMCFLNIDHDSQLLNNIFDLLLELTFWVDIKEWNLKLRGVAVGARAIDLPSSLGPTP